MKPAKTKDVYSALHDLMQTFHNIFRGKVVYLKKELPQSATSSQQDLIEIFSEAGELAHYLEMHHSIEEANMFPLLATKMPEFASHAAMHQEHEAMVKALGNMTDYAQIAMKNIKNKQFIEKREADGVWPQGAFDPIKMLTLVDELSSVLLPHLEHEEQSISAENMKKAGWSEKEMMRWTRY